jgi:predicted metal-binding membrane protein
MMPSGRARPTVNDPVTALVRRDRALVWGGVAGVTLLAWLYLWRHAHMMAMADGMAVLEPRLQPWTAGDFVLMTTMWVVMMVAMMLPAAAPVILLFAAVGRKRREAGGVAVPTAVFALGYLAVWGGFSVGATLAQWGLHRAALLSPTLQATSPLVGGLLLVAAGLYQATPLKEVCLAHCRSPFAFVMTAWRDGFAGALQMGLRHGTYCLGCCWALMGLLFVAGVMNLAWVAAITAFVLLEKVAPGGRLIGRAAGVVLALAGAWLLGRAAGLVGA